MNFLWVLHIGIITVCLILTGFCVYGFIDECKSGYGNPEVPFVLGLFILFLGILLTRNLVDTQQRYNKAEYDFKVQGFKVSSIDASTNEIIIVVDSVKIPCRYSEKNNYFYIPKNKCKIKQTIKAQEKPKPSEMESQESLKNKLKKGDK